MHPEYQIKTSILLLLQHCITVLEKLENVGKKEDMCIISLQTERMNNYPSLFNIRSDNFVAAKKSVLEIL